MLCLVIAVGVTAVFPFLGSPSLWDFDEAFYAEISRNMAEGQDWVVPVFNGRAGFDKPPLLYWLTALWYKAFGPSELGSRVFSACFLVVTCAVTFLIGERLFTARVGLLAGAILGTSGLTVILGRMGLMDTGLMFFVVTAVYLLLTAGERARLTRYIGSGALIGLGMLIKGPIAAFLALVCGLGAIGPARFLKRLREVRPGVLGEILRVSPGFSSDRRDDGARRSALLLPPSHHSRAVSLVVDTGSYALCAEEFDGLQCRTRSSYVSPAVVCASLCLLQRDLD
jgi:4-amino-4-deoxy-L-arabinose transferase-like glycosyltransferase